MSLRGQVAATFCLMVLGAASLPAGATAFAIRPGDEGFSVSAREENGSLDQQAGSHPFKLNTEINLDTVESPGEPGVPFSEGDLRDLRLDLPPGMIENPAAVPECSLADFHTPRSSPYEKPSLSGESCPDRTQIGTVAVRSSYGGGVIRTFGLFNLVPPPGSPSAIGFNPYGAPVVFLSEVRQAEGSTRSPCGRRTFPSRSASAACAWKPGARPGRRGTTSSAAIA